MANFFITIPGWNKYFKQVLFLAILQKGRKEVRIPVLRDDSSTLNPGVCKGNISVSSGFFNTQPVHHPGN